MGVAPLLSPTAEELEDVMSILEVVGAPTFLLWGRPPSTGTLNHNVSREVTGSAWARVFADSGH